MTPRAEKVPAIARLRLSKPMFGVSLMKDMTFLQQMT